jgi:hypothetical protein
VTCVQDDEAAARRALAKATTLNFEFYPAPPAPVPSGAAAGDAGGASSGAGAGGAGAAAAGAGASGGDAAAASGGGGAGGPVRMSLPALHKYTEPEDAVLRRLARHYGVPREAQFELLCRIRAARAYGTLEGRRRVVRQRLQALCLLLHSAPQQGGWLRAQGRGAGHLAAGHEAALFSAARVRACLSCLFCRSPASVALPTFPLPPEPHPPTHPAHAAQSSRRTWRRCLRRSPRWWRSS